MLSTNRQDLGTTDLDISITEIRRATWGRAVLAQVTRTPGGYVQEDLLLHIVSEVGPERGLARKVLASVLHELEESRMIVRLPIGVCPTEAGRRIGQLEITGPRPQPRGPRRKGAR